MAPPITPDDLTKLQIEPQLIPFVVSTSLRAERSPNGSPPLSPVEAETLVEILDKVRTLFKLLPALNPTQSGRVICRGESEFEE